MKIFILVLVITCPFLAHSKTCLQDQEGAREVYAQGYFAEPEAGLEVTELPSSKGMLFKVHDPNSCGVRGCEFVLAHTNAKNCLVLSFVGFGPIRALKPKDYSSFEQKVKFLPVDKVSSVKKTYQLNLKSFVFEEK